MVTTAPIDVDDERLGPLLQLYHEWSGLNLWPIGDDALRPHTLHPSQYSDTRTAFLFFDPSAATPIGFTLVRCAPADCWNVEHFFVIAGARRRGLGKSAAEALFATRPGLWTLTVRAENAGALGFWRSVRHLADEDVEVGEDGIARARFSYLVSLLIP